MEFVLTAMLQLMRTILDAGGAVRGGGAARQASAAEASAFHFHIVRHGSVGAVIRSRLQAFVKCEQSQERGVARGREGGLITLPPPGPDLSAAEIADRRGGAAGGEVEKEGLDITSLRQTTAFYYGT